MNRLACLDFHRENELRLRRKSTRRDTTSGGVFNQITNNTWLENLTWNSKPAVDGVQFAALGPAALNSFWISI